MAEKYFRNAYLLHIKKINTTENTHVTTNNTYDSFFIPKTSFYNTHFKHNAYFDNINFTNEVNFQNAIFRSDACFSKSIFTEISFSKVKFLNKKRFTLFDNTHFKFECNFYGAIFNGHTFFNNTTFSGLIIFGSDTGHINSIFNEHASFRNTTFEDKSFFISCDFIKGASFHNSKFNKQLVFTSRSTKERIDFFECEFKSTSFFSGSKVNDIDFEQSIFHELSDFSDIECKGLFNIQKTIFEKQTIFNESKFKGGFNAANSYFKSWALFRSTLFGKNIIFNDAICDKNIILDKNNLSKFLINKVNIEYFQFLGCKWGESKFSPIYDEYKQNELRIHNTELEEIYCRLKKLSRLNYDEMQTSHWHYREKEMQRKELSKMSTKPFLATLLLITTSLIALHWGKSSYVSVILMFIVCTIYCPDGFKKNPDWFEKIYINIYFFISGYGERPLRAFITLLGILAISFCSAAILAPQKTPSAPAIELPYLKEWLWYLPLTKIKIIEPTGLNYLFKTIFNILITVQAALFAFALRNKLRR